MINTEILDLSQNDGTITVSLSNELVQLLSDQLYSSPLKAIEELVVNSYDAQAENCIVYVPNLNDGLFQDKSVMVIDDGHGMDADGLRDLWKIGRSNKLVIRNKKIAERKLIGKFGIGKLATYSISKKITYISKYTSGIIHSVTLDYDKFQSNSTGVGRPVKLPLLRIINEAAFYSSPVIKRTANSLHIEVKDFLIDKKSWTVVILEDLKPKTLELQVGRLKWVLATAMPIIHDFKLFLGNEEIESSKLSYKKISEFTINDLPESSIKKLREKSGLNWSVQGD